MKVLGKTKKVKRQGEQKKLSKEKKGGSVTQRRDTKKYFPYNIISFKKNFKNELFIQNQMQRKGNLNFFGNYA